MPRRRTALVTMGLVCAVGSLALGLNALAGDDQRVSPGPDAPAPAGPEAGIEARQPSPGERTPYPASLENQPSVRHSSGGPYISDAKAIEHVKQTLCPSHLTAVPGARDCSQYKFTSRFYNRYEDAYGEHASTGWGFVGFWGRDREVYFVSVTGTIPAYDLFKVPTEPGTGPVTIDHWNAQVDATTGEVLGQGTAGRPLS